LEVIEKLWCGGEVRIGRSPLQSESRISQAFQCLVYASRSSLPHAVDPASRMSRRDVTVVALGATQGLDARRVSANVRWHIG
jgi:hypothetical protein